MANSVNNFSHDQELSLEAGDAVSAVFGITELLLPIISELPREHRTTIRRVSKAWYDAVMNIGHVFDPVGYGYLGYHWQKYLRNPNMPLYPSGTLFQFNPALSWHQTPHNTNYPLHHWGYTLQFDEDWDFPNPAQQDSEFITNPPLTQLVLCAGSDDDARVSNLRVPGGIRIGDLKLYLMKMIPEEDLREKCVCFSLRTEKYMLGGTERYAHYATEPGYASDESVDRCEWVDDESSDSGRAGRKGESPSRMERFGSGLVWQELLTSLFEQSCERRARFHFGMSFFP